MKKTYKILSAVLAAVLFSTAFTLFPSVKKEETVYAAGNITHENSAQTARSIADEGTVLLRNTGALPLKRSDRVVMCGSEKTIFGGGGSGWVNTTEKISYSDGMTAASSAGKIRLFSVKNFGSVDGSDKVLYVISRETTENADRSRSSFYLTATEKNELSAVCSAVGSANVIVLLNVGSVVDTTWLIEKNVGAIVACYFGGSVAGESLAAVLCGEVSPSGKTSDTWAKSLGDYPSESALKVLVGDNNVGNIPLKRTSVAPDVALENNKFVCAQSDSLVVTLAKGENVITLETEDTALGCLETLYVEKADGNRIHTGNYSDNTAEFDGKTPSLEGKKLDKVITYNDVLFDPSLMDDFVSQLSVIDLIYMHGTDAKNQTGEINTGAVFGDWNPSYPHIPLVASGNNFKSFNAEYSNLIAAYKSRIITREQLESNVKTALKFLMLTNCNKQQVFAVDESIEISAANTAASSVGDGKLKRMYRFYIRNEGKYSLDVVGLKEGVAVTLDGAEISGKTDNVTMSLGLHELIVSGDITSVNALEKLVINAAFCSGARHSWGEWQVIKNETCVQPGTKERVCSVCGKTESEEIAPNGKHNYENGRCTICSALQPGASHEHIFGEWTVVKQATCLEKGERTRVCDCGARETESTPLALHDYKDGVCSVCGNKKPGGGENNSVPTGGCRSAGNTLPAMLIVCAILAIAYLPMRKK